MEIWGSALCFPSPKSRWAFPQPEEWLFVIVLLVAFDDPAHPVSSICG